MSSVNRQISASIYNPFAKSTLTPTPINKMGLQFKKNLKELVAEKAAYGPQPTIANIALSVQEVPSSIPTTTQQPDVNGIASTKADGIAPVLTDVEIIEQAIENLGINSASSSESEEEEEAPAPEVFGPSQRSRLAQLAYDGREDMKDLKEAWVKEVHSLDHGDLAGETPLHLACSQGHLKIVEWLINYCDATVDPRAADGSTPLLLAVANGHFKVAEYLMDEKAAFKMATDDYGESIWSHAERLDTTESIAFLRKYDQDWWNDHDVLPRVFQAKYHNKPLGAKNILANTGANLKGFDQLHDQPFAYVPAHVRKCYFLTKFLGAGAFSSCYLAIDRKSGKEVAIKATSYKRACEEPSSQRTEREKIESRAVVDVHHPHIATPIMTGTFATFSFSIEEKAECTLQKHFEDTHMTANDIIVMGVQLLLGLKHLHTRHHRIHCDLKPDNVLVYDQPWESACGTMKSDKTFKIADLGNSADFDPKDKKQMIGNWAGTPIYQPRTYDPSRFGVAGPPCDVYALGCILYEAWVWACEHTDKAIYGAAHPDMDDTWKCRTKDVRHTIYRRVRDQKNSPYWETMDDNLLDLIDNMIQDKAEKRQSVLACHARLWELNGALGDRKEEWVMTPGRTFWKGKVVAAKAEAEAAAKEEEEVDIQEFVTCPAQPEGQ